MHNLGTVIGFEVIRTLKKKSFWITALLFPVIVSIVFAIIFLSSKATDKAADESRNQHFTLAVTDQSGLISPKLLNNFKAKTVADKQQAINNVSQGKLDAYFFYPSDVSKYPVEVYAKDVGLFDNNRYQGIAQVLLQQSVAPDVGPQTTSILQGKVSYDATTYKNGEPYNGFAQLIAPGMFLVLFYVLIIVFGNQMLTSTTEEKENRVIEMILTTIKAKVLITGKILSMIALAFIQVITIIVPILLIYLLTKNQLALPSIDLSNIPIDPTRITFGALIFIFSFLLFTGILVAIGSMVPTAKEAGSFFGAVMVFMFAPLYAVALFVSAPDSPVVTFLSLFPLTAPIPLMLRNAVGNLSSTEAILGIIIIAISAVLVLMLATRLFRYGALEYSKRLSLRTVVGRKKNIQKR